MERTAKLTFEGHELELRIEESVEGELATDISGLYGKTGATTLDRSLASTALCRSQITYIELNVNVELMNEFRGATFLPHTNPGLFPSVTIPERALGK